MKSFVFIRCFLMVDLIIVAPMRPSPYPLPGARRYSFEDFILDIDGGFLRRLGEEVPLQRKAFDVLCYLVERHGRLVT